MYMLIQVGSEIIHYSLLPYLLPSQSLKSAPQSQTFIEYRTTLIRLPLTGHWMSNLWSPLFYSVFWFLNGWVLVHIINQLCCLPTHFIIRIHCYSYIQQCKRKDWVSWRFGNQLRCNSLFILEASSQYQLR